MQGSGFGLIEVTRPKELAKTTKNFGQDRQVGAPTDIRNGNSRHIKQNRYRFIQLTEVESTDTIFSTFKRVMKIEAAGTSETSAD